VAQPDSTKHAATTMSNFCTFERADARSTQLRATFDLLKGSGVSGVAAETASSHSMMLTSDYAA
jgi:hypothetical protein